MSTSRSAASIHLNSKNSRSLILVSGQIIIILVSIFYFFVPYIREILDYREEIAQKKDEYSELTEYANYLADLAESSLSLDKEVIDYALPSENDVITILLTYEGIAQESEDVVISPISLEPGVLESASVESEGRALSNATSGVQELEFTMTAQTPNRASAEALFEEIYSARRIFVIHTTSWALDEGGQINMELDLSAYHMQNPTVEASKALVRQGQGQEQFINEYRDTKVYEELVLDGVQIGKANLFVPQGDYYDPEASLSAEFTEIPISSSAAELEIDLFATGAPTPTPNTTTTEERVFEEIFGDVLP